MQNSVLKVWLDFFYFFGVNQSWIEQFYEDFLIDFDLVDVNWCLMFQQLFGMGVKLD